MTLPKVSLYHARGVFYHSIGCNIFFRGDGLSPAGLPELIYPNVPITSIPDCIVVDLLVTLEDVLRLKQLSQGAS